MIIVIILISCFLSNDDDGRELLRNLTRINKPLRITLEQMMRLIAQCDLLDPNQVNADDVKIRGFGSTNDETDSNGNPTTPSNSLYSGILPGNLLILVDF